jgi:D-mannonate dehydratase
MDERTPEVNHFVREITFEDWLSEQKEELSRVTGILEALTERPSDKSWDMEPIKRQKALLDEVIKPLWIKVRKLQKDNENLQKSIEERDAQITDILVKTQQWMKHYQGLLDEIEKER